MNGRHNSPSKGNLMTIHARRLFLVPVLLIACAAAAFAQGVAWQMTTTRAGEEGGKQTRFLYMPKKYKIIPEDEMTSILRLDQEKVMLVDMKRKRYHEMTFAEMESMLKTVDRQMEAARKQLDQLPPEQRKMAEEMMGKMHAKKGADKVDVQKTGETKTISGYTCTKYILKRDGVEVTTIWATPEVGIPQATWKQMWKEMAEFGKRLASLMPESDESFMEKSRTMIDGFPIQTVMKDKTVMTVSKIESRSVPADEFDVPAGFTKENNPPMGGEQD
jgi:GLPGLI family protein